MIRALLRSPRAGLIMGAQFQGWVAGQDAETSLSPSTASTQAAAQSLPDLIQLTLDRLEYNQALGDPWRAPSEIAGLLLEEHWPASAFPLPPLPQQPKE